MQKTNNNPAITLFACVTMAAAAALLNIRCSINPVADSEAGNPVILSSAALITMPTSLASAYADRYPAPQAGTLSDDDKAKRPAFRH